MAECLRHTVGHPANRRQGGTVDKVLLTLGRLKEGVVPLVRLSQAYPHYHPDLLRMMMMMMMMLTTIRHTNRILECGQKVNFGEAK